MPPLKHIQLAASTPNLQKSAPLAATCKRGAWLAAHESSRTISISTSCPLDTGSRAISHCSSAVFIVVDTTRCLGLIALAGGKGIIRCFSFAAKKMRQVTVIFCAKKAPVRSGLIKGRVDPVDQLSTASGCFSAICSRRAAAPDGRRMPFSHLMSVESPTPSRAAKSFCDKPYLARSAPMVCPDLGVR